MHGRATVWEYSPNRTKRRRRRRELVDKTRSQGSTPKNVLRGGSDNGEPIARANGSSTNIVECRAVADVMDNAGPVAAQSALII